MSLTPECPVYRAVLPLKKKIPRLQCGSILSFRGNIPQKSTGFIINLVFDAGEGKLDIVLHLSVRLNSKVVVRNHLVAGTWGQEERDGGLGRLRPGHPFDCMLLVTEHCYKIAFNGQHFADFRHRLPYGGVSILQVDSEGEQKTNFQSIYVEGVLQEGENKKCNHLIPMDEQNLSFSNSNPKTEEENQDTENKFKKNEKKTIAPYSYLPKAPHFQSVGKSLSVGSKVYVTGVPHEGAKNFTINLRVGQDDKGDIGLHMASRFERQSEKSVVVFNSYEKGKWQAQESVNQHFPFKSREHCDISIVCVETGMEIHVNNVFFHFFKNRLDLKRINTVEVSGEIKVVHVRLWTGEPL